MEWQPIETAPSDETEILGAWYLRSVGRWMIEPVIWRREKFQHHYVVNWDFSDAEPTHWMPMPEPPETD